MHSKQKIQTARFSKAKTVTSYFIAGHYLMCSSLAYAGHGFGENDGDPNSKTTITRPLNKPSNESQENSGGSFSYFSSFQNAASNTFNWLHESALDGCEKFGKWVASYAEDLPPSYFAKSLLEVDYVNDELFWKGHFNQELEDIKEKPYLGFQEQRQLKDLQDIVWNGLLSPYTYEKALQKLQKQRLFYAVRNIRSAFQSELKENPEIVLEHLRKDLLKSLEGMQNNREGSEQRLLTKFEKKLTYYRNAMNAFDYGETLGRLLNSIEEQKEKLALSATQHEGLKESLNDALSKINKAEYLQIREERQAISIAQKTSVDSTEENAQEKELALTKMGNSFSDLWKLEYSDTQNYFSYPLFFAKGAGSLIQRGVSFALENPGQAITMGLAFQAAAVAAASSFSATQFNRIQKMGSSSNVIDLASLSSTQGFMIEAASAGDASGISVSSAGDFNGDGLSDVIVGAYLTRNQAGASYVIYGKKGGYPHPVDLASLNSTQGVIIEGARSSDGSGGAVSSAGDFNGDGLSDIIIGATTASPLGRNLAGTSYVIYGKKGGYPAPIDLASINANQGVIIEGAGANYYSGGSVSLAGDFNGDGLSDVIIGALGARPQGRTQAGASYVIYGKKGGYPAPIDLASLNANQGVIIEGATAGDNSGDSVSLTGDFNGDGVGDIIVGASNSNPLGRKGAGSSYVIYGQKGGYPTPIDLSSLSATQGFIIEGAAAGDESGYSVSSAGDFNGDGLSDIIIGAPDAYPLGRAVAGVSYVIYGKKGGYPHPVDLASLNATQGVIIEGARSSDRSGGAVSSAGDFNGDGLSDIIIGATTASPLGRDQAGTSYVIYGKKGGYPAPIDLASLDTNHGIIIEGGTAWDNSGTSVSSAGDFNGDGLSDVIIGAPAYPLGRTGDSYVIYGSNNTMKSINSVLNNRKKLNNNG